MDHFINFLRTGGIFMFPMILCAIVGLGIIIERTIALRRSLVITDSLVAAVQQYQAGEDIQRLNGQAIGDGSVLGKLIQTVLANIDLPKSECAEAVQVRGRAESGRLERGLVTLEIIVGIGPLLGLLGTVSGLIRVFAEFGGKESAVEAAGIAAGISEALNMTVAGLVIAIPALIVHAYYSKRIERYMVEMESLCLDLLTKLYRGRTQ